MSSRTTSATRAAGREGEATSTPTRVGRCGPVGVLLLCVMALWACSPGGRHRVLKFFFDGVPDRVDPAVVAPGPESSAEGTASRAPAVARPVGPGAAPPADPLPAIPPPPKAPLEKARSWEEAMAALPTDYVGGVDWVRAVAEGLSAPKLKEPDGAKVEPPFTLDTVVHAGGSFPDRAFLDLDLDLAPDDKPLFEVRFPHAAHTFRLACSSCHPGAGAMRTKMDRILDGEACGRCHGKVAFDPQIACARCHEKLLPAEGAVVEEETSRALAAPEASTPEMLARGGILYEQNCAFCHGEKGDGQGRLAPWLDPKPRDFTAGKYKFRTTIGTALPTDADLFRTITRGVPGTSMPAWGVLPYEDRWALVHFIKSYSERFSAEEPPTPISIPEPPEITEELLASGRDLYKQAGCHSCHGMTGHGDGPSAATLKDDWGNPILPFNFASGRPLKSGSSVSDLFRIVMTGLPGTPMPGFGEVLDPQMAWALASYVDSLRGAARAPFAVRGDIAFERQELPPQEEVAATDLEGLTVEDMAADELFLLAGKDIPPATFPHWFHRIRFKCSSCHPAIFEMKAGANPITMTAMRRGEFCANCHNGNEAWEIGFTTCVRCHAAR